MDLSHLLGYRVEQVNLGRHQPIQVLSSPTERFRMWGAVVVVVSSMAFSSAWPRG